MKKQKIPTPPPLPGEKRSSRVWKRTVFVFAVTVSFFVILTLSLYSPQTDLVQQSIDNLKSFRISSMAMSPTIISGDYVLAEKIVDVQDEIERGDVIVFRYPPDPEKYSLKRIIGLPGDTLVIIDNQVYLDGEKLEESYVEYDKDASTDYDNFGPIEVLQDKLFVLGDNRRNSADSRVWGFVDIGSVEYKAKRIFFSKDRKTDKIRWNRIGKSIE